MKNAVSLNTIQKSINNLHLEMNERFDRLETKVDRIDDSLDEVAVYAIKTHEIVEKLSTLPPRLRKSYQHA